MSMSSPALSSSRPRIDLLRRVGRAVGDLLGVAAPDAGQAAVLRAHYGLLGALAAIDHIVTSHEVELVSAVMERDRLSIAARSLALAAFDDGRRRRLDLFDAVADLLDGARAGRADPARVLDDLIALAASDGRIRRSEREWLVTVCACLNMDPEGLDRRMRQHHALAA